MKIKVVFGVFALFFCLSDQPFFASAQQTMNGHWAGEMVREGAKLPVSFDFLADASGGVKATFNSPTQRATGIPLRNFSFSDSRIHFELVGDATTIVFDGVLAGVAINGTFRENSAHGTFALRLVNVKGVSFRQEEVIFRNGETILSGTLLLPMTMGPHPSVIFLHGSGAEGRFASRFLAEHLAGRGIAALIYDKRGVGKSTGDWRRSDFNDLAGDGLSAIALLKQRKDIKPENIGIYGHSQGGTIGPLVASRTQDLAFIISAAGSAVPQYEAEVNSVVNQVRAQGVTGPELDEATVFIKLLLDVLRTGNGWEQFEVETEKVRTKRWYPMLQIPPKDNWFWAFFKRIANYNAAEYWASITIPSLVIYGERDILVPVAPSIANIDRALNKAGNKDYTILVLPRASHAFNIGPEPGQPFEWTRLSPGFPDLLTAWINQRSK